MLFVVHAFSGALTLTAAMILHFFNPYPHVKLVFVMVVCPLIMSCLALWVTDLRASVLFNVKFLQKRFLLAHCSSRIQLRSVLGLGGGDHTAERTQQGTRFVVAGQSW